MWFLLSELPSLFCNSKKKSQSHKKVYENKHLCNVVMPSEGTKILKLNQYQKSDKALFVIYADLDCLIKRIGGCKNNHQNSLTTKVREHNLSGFYMSTISSFKRIENKHDIYRGKDCMKKYYESLREHAMNIKNFKKKKMKFIKK